MSSVPLQVIYLVRSDSRRANLSHCQPFTLIRRNWMLPGVPHTGRRVEVPLVAIVQFRDGKLAHDHIYWDQAAVLVQIGLLDPDNLLVAGVAEARKVADKTLPSNALMANWAKSDRFDWLGVPQAGNRAG